MAIIRQANEADDNEIVGLLLKSFQRLYDVMGFEMLEERKDYLSAHGARRTFSTTFVSEEDGRIIGTVTITPPSSHSEAWIDGAWDLRLLAVDPDAQKQGVATALIASAERYAKNAGAREMCLHARRGIDNQARLYLANRYRRDPAGDISGPPFQDGYTKRLDC